MPNMFVVKGPSGIGKGTRVVQFIEFLRSKFIPEELFYEVTNKAGKVTRKPLGLLFKEFNLVFIGSYTISNKSNLASWTSMDSLHAALKTGEAARAELLKLTQKGYSLVCEGEPLMLSDKWRPAFLKEHFGLDKLIMVYFHYNDREQYDERILGRSGKVAGDSGWGRNESYPKEFLKSRDELLSMGGVRTDLVQQDNFFSMNFDDKFFAKLYLYQHDAPLNVVGEAIIENHEPFNGMFDIDLHGANRKTASEFVLYCDEEPMLRNVDGANPLAGRVGVSKEVPKQDVVQKAESLHMMSTIEPKPQKSVSIWDRLFGGKK